MAAVSAPTFLSIPVGDSALRIVCEALRSGGGSSGDLLPPPTCFLVPVPGGYQVQPAPPALPPKAARGQKRARQVPAAKIPPATLLPAVEVVAAPAADSSRYQEVLSQVPDS